MKRFFERIGSLIPHISLITSLMILVFWTIDTFFNKFMGFMSNKYTTVVVVILAFSSLIGSVLLIIHQRREAVRYTHRMERKLRKQERE